MNARADLNYQQGLNRMWSRKTRFDFYWPALANLGEQAILQQEIFTTNIEAENQTVLTGETVMDERPPPRYSGFCNRASGESTPK